MHHDGLVPHPIRATTHEVARLHRIAAEGSSPPTPAILVGLVLGFVITVPTLLMLLVFGVTELS